MSGAAEDFPAIEEDLAIPAVPPLAIVPGDLRKPRQPSVADAAEEKRLRAIVRPSGWSEWNVQRREKLGALLAKRIEEGRRADARASELYLEADKAAASAALRRKLALDLHRQAREAESEAEVFALDAAAYLSEARETNARALAQSEWARSMLAAAETSGAAEAAAVLESRRPASRR